MFRLTIAGILFFACCSTLAAQTAAPTVAPAPPQTARQALLEMFLGTTPGAFEKHLPKATQAFLKTDGGKELPVSELFEISSEIRQPGRILETFDEGPILLRSQDRSAEQTVEVSVESEADSGDEDDFQLSVRIYRAGRPIPLPFLPTFTCIMKMESEAWRLDAILVNLRIPIGDPNFLDNLSHRMGAVGSMTEESQGLRHLRAIASAQESYAAAFPNRGFACSLADLGGTGDGTPGRPSGTDDRPNL